MIFLDLDFGRHYCFPLEYEFWQHQLDVLLYQHLKLHSMKETLVEQPLEHLDFELEAQSYLEFVRLDHLDHLDRLDLLFLVVDPFEVDPVVDTFDFGLEVLPLVVQVVPFAVEPFAVLLDLVVVVLVPNLDIVEHLLA